MKYKIIAKIKSSCKIKNQNKILFRKNKKNYQIKKNHNRILMMIKVFTMIPHWNSRKDKDNKKSIRKNGNIGLSNRMRNLKISLMNIHLIQIIK